MQPHRFTVVCGIDLSEYSSTVLTHVLDQAARRGGADLHVITVIPDGSGSWRRPSEGELEASERAAKQRLTEVVRDALEVQGAREQSQHVWLHARRGIPEEQIVDLAAEAGADMIIVGRFGAGSRGRKLVGSVADRVIAASECPVLVVQGASYYAPTGMADECPECIAIRKSTKAEAWFCPTHRTGSFARASVLIGGPSTGGMW